GVACRARRRLGVGRTWRPRRAAAVLGRVALTGGGSAYRSGGRHGVRGAGLSGDTRAVLGRVAGVAGSGPADAGGIRDDVLRTALPADAGAALVGVADVGGPVTADDIDLLRRIVRRTGRTRLSGAAFRIVAEGAVYGRRTADDSRVPGG